MRRVLPLLLLLALTAQCARETGPFSERERIPDAQGIVTAITFEQVQIDGKRSYPISSDVESFSTYNGKVTPLLSWKNDYVHVGLNDDKEAIWIAGIGVVIQQDRKIVLYTNGLLERVDDERRAIFADGTVLRLAKNVARPKPRERLNVTIDVERDVITEIQKQGV